MTSANATQLIGDINQLKKEKEAVILVHNYQRPEIYEVADYIGDSFGLAKKASELKDVKRIIFCGVDFMAESAAILSPDKEVYLPTLQANCPMAAMVDSKSLKQLQEQHPDAATVCYVNTSADIKAMSYVCCTSSNAEKIIKALPQKDIIFVPDKNLAMNTAKQLPEKNIIPWNGHCYVHQRFTVDEMKKSKENYPDAEIIAHPECPPEVAELADCLCSTSQMIDYARNSKADTFIVFTEVGMTERLKKEVPEKQFLTPVKTCLQMKKNSLTLIKKSLTEERYRITVPDEISQKAKLALERMLKLG